jgi:ubiquinone/menaquinone biosynthesis C-methylase UbiE
MWLRNVKGRNVQSTKPGSEEIVHEIREHYTDRHNEADRLVTTLKGRLELQRLKELLTEHLPAAPAEIADIGGGPGRHAAWLAELGHDVQLLDPIQRHVEQAKAAGINAVIGDARQLPWDNESKDVVLMAGPMYHLTRAEERRVAVREAVRVLRPGGVLAVIAINRNANLIGSTLANTLQARRGVVEDILNDGYSFENERMAETTYHTVAQLRSELAPFVDRVRISGLTGPGGWLTVVIDAHFKDLPLPPSMGHPDPFETALACSRLADKQPHLAEASSLLLAIGKRV